MDPHPGFFDFNDAAELMPEEDLDKAYIDPNRPKKQRLRDALARGELPSDGMIIATELSEDLPEKGEVRHVRPAVYQKKTMGHANSIKGCMARVHQDGLILKPIIRKAAFSAWLMRRAARMTDPASDQSVPNGVGLMVSLGYHAKPSDFLAPSTFVPPSDYLAFEQIVAVAKAWNNSHPVEASADGVDMEQISFAIGMGILPLFRIDRRSGEVAILPVSTLLAGDDEDAPGRIRALTGNETIFDEDGEPYLLVVRKDDFDEVVRALTTATDAPGYSGLWEPRIPPDADLSESDSKDVLYAWMHGLAEGYRLNNRLIKREDAIRLARELRKVTWRAGEAAFEALPQELRNPDPKKKGAVAKAPAPL